MSNEQELEGIGGWLILVAIGIILSPLKIIGLIGTTYFQIFSTEVWANLTTPESEVYHSLWKPILLGEFSINLILVITWFYIAYLFFNKKKIFPKCYIGVIVFTLIFVILDAFAVKMVLPNEPVFDPDTMKEITQSAAMIVIWVPYMLVSKRVKATFKG